VTKVVLVALAILFPVVVAVFPLEGEAYVLGKLVLLMIVPASMLLAERGAVKIEWNKDASRWWAPAVVIVVQGSFGLFVGVLWWRYRNLAAIIVVHLISNGWAVAKALL
jgi:hypothetical protein